MPSRVFLFLLTAISTLVILTSPPILGQLIQHTPTSTPTSLRPTHTPTATSTTDPFASVPTATLINPNETILVQPPPADGSSALDCSTAECVTPALTILYFGRFSDRCSSLGTDDAPQKPHTETRRHRPSVAIWSECGQCKVQYF